jgi:4-amino-4-deoxy-L-arabinose transferase-like glycosyltransferase
MTIGLPEISNRHLEDQSSKSLTIARLIKSETLWFGLLLAIIVLLASFGLEGYPRLGYDEGYYLQLTKNFLLHGEYALTSPPQESDWFGLGNSSPTLVLPVALSFKFFGVGVTQARLVSALYLIGAVVAVYLLMRYLYGWPTAALSAALFIIAGPSGASLLDSSTLTGRFGTVWMGRKVLGEVPALFFLLLGAWAWFHSWDRGSKRWLAGAGLLFGLTFVTKEQFLPVVIPALGLVWLADRLYYQKLKLKHFAVPVILSSVLLGAWYGYKLFVLGPEAFGRHLTTLGQVSRASTWYFLPSSWAGHLSFLYNNAFHLLGLVGILYAFVLSVRRDLYGLKSLFLPTLATGFLAWYTFLSIGWPRYAYPGLALATMLAAKPLSDLIAGFSFAPRRLWTNLQQGNKSWAVVAAIVAVIMIGYPLQDLTRQVLFETDLMPQQFATYLETHTERDALIESFEWQIDFLTTRHFHHPPAEVFVQLLKNSPDRTYNPLVAGPNYLIDGPYSKGAQLYPAPWLRQCCRKIGTVGDYDLYTVLDAEMP